ncbi:MAG TPA: phosphatase [Cyanobacteria bacterium UBA11369]|nr:phosphatase [Cyanobacteria bacterium UBA11371]HBE32662.1 phosphatase [Cyanobacteria bacterium UBA11368]HBE50102.1 phosphatase [Cyanobacteria bacterium UBA11369]
MKLKRRELLLFLGASAATAALGSFLATRKNFPGKDLSFQPVKGAMPLDIYEIAPAQQVKDYSTYEVIDDLVLPEGYTYDIVAAWGDKIGNSRFGYNNDYLSFIETGKDEGYLTINFEYISAIPWMQTYQQVTGKSLPFAEVQAAVKKAPKAGINAFALPKEEEALKAKIRQICTEALLDQGMGVISIRRDADGKWVRTNSKADRRISGISGLEDNRYLKATGPGAAVFRKTQGQGYIDKLGDRIIGTFANCAGGTTPWGTVLSGEENFQNQVAEPVYADGTSFDPKERPFSIDDEEISGQGNVLGLAGNKYGFIVEIDPANPNDYGTKHTWLGRYRHEAVGVRVVAGKPLAFYSGCDRRGGHLYKFVSKANVTNPQDKANSRLLRDGMLYAAQFNPDGTGRWIPLKPDTPVNPTAPGNLEGNLLPLPKRPEGGIFNSEKAAEVNSFKQKFKTLGDLYAGNPQEKQGAILIDAHYAANAAGATCTARPEDTEIASDGSLYVTFTSGSAGGEGGPDKRIFKGPKGESPWEYGWIMHLIEDNNEPAALTFKWKMLAMGGNPAEGGAGFSNPDNLVFDQKGNLWMVNDMSTTKQNNPKDKQGVGCFGNNSIWFIPTSGSNAGNAYLFGIGPMECETTGPFFTQDQQTLFLAIQHPGEVHGIRQNSAVENREFEMKTTDGQSFKQTRSVPLGSNWPSKNPNDPPKPAVVAIRRTNAQPII